MTYQEHPWIGIDAIILNEEKNKILLIKRWWNTYYWMWGLISGKLDWGEEVKEAVLREVKEETNLDVEIIRYIGRYYDKRWRHPTKTMICLPHICKIIWWEMKAGDDALEARWFSFEEVKNMDLAFDHKQVLLDEKLI